MPGVVLFEKDGRIGRIILNRPEKLNALNSEVHVELAERLDEAASDPDTRVVILKGAGRAFSSGGDYSQGNAFKRLGNPVEAQELMTKTVDLLLKVWDLPKPVIAQVHGYCFGVATRIVTVCDLTMVSEDCRIGWPQIPDGGGTISPLWLWLVGPKRAKEGSFALKQFTGKEVAAWGWANHAVPADRLEEETENLARAIARVPSDILRLKKLANNRVMDSMGFRNTIVQIELDAILKFSPAALQMQEQMRELGWKKFLQKFQAEGL